MESETIGKFLNELLIFFIEESKRAPEKNNVVGFGLTESFSVNNEIKILKFLISKYANLFIFQTDDKAYSEFSEYLQSIFAELKTLRTILKQILQKMRDKIFEIDSAELLESFRAAKAQLDSLQNALTTLIANVGADAFNRKIKIK